MQTSLMQKIEQIKQGEYKKRVKIANIIDEIKERYSQRTT